MVRCLRCDQEFPLEGLITKDQENQKAISEYMNNIVNNYNKSVGKKGTR